MLPKRRGIYFLEPRPENEGGLYIWVRHGLPPRPGSGQAGDGPSRINKDEGGRMRDEDDDVFRLHPSSFAVLILPPSPRLAGRLALLGAIAVGRARLLPSRIKRGGSGDSYRKNQRADRRCAPVF